MWIDSPEQADLAPLFAEAEAGPVAPVSTDRLASITAAGRRRRRLGQAAIVTPVVLASAGIVAGGIALTSNSPRHATRLAIRPAASSRPAHAKAAAQGCNETTAHHYLVAAEIPAGLADRKELVPTAAVPIDIAFPGATASDPGLDFKVACTSATSTGGTSVDINGVTGSISHHSMYTTIAWSPAAGFQVSYTSFAGSNGPTPDSVLIAMARAVPTAP